MYSFDLQVTFGVLWFGLPYDNPGLNVKTTWLSSDSAHKSQAAASYTWEKLYHCSLIKQFT